MNSIETSVFPAIFELETLERGSSNAVLSEMVKARSSPFHIVKWRHERELFGLTLEICNAPIPALERYLLVL